MTGARNMASVSPGPAPAGRSPELAGETRAQARPVASRAPPCRRPASPQRPSRPPKAISSTPTHWFWLAPQLLSGTLLGQALPSLQVAGSPLLAPLDLPSPPHLVPSPPCLPGHVREHALLGQWLGSKVESRLPAVTCRVVRSPGSCARAAGKRVKGSHGHAGLRR